MNCIKSMFQTVSDNLKREDQLNGVGADQDMMDVSQLPQAEFYQIPTSQAGWPMGQMGGQFGMSNGVQFGSPGQAQFGQVATGNQGKVCHHFLA